LNITGIIVEYNPFHNGHLYHINESKKITNSDGIIGIMSGNFTQRGIPAIVDKWTRAKMALLNGVDLVLELPAIYSLSSAEFFSFGAITLLDGIGITNNICFGSELGHIQTIKYIANILHTEPLEFKKSLKNQLDNGESYPVAREKALCEYLYNNQHNCLSFNNLLGLSNNILAIEYCKNLLKINSKIAPFTIKRLGGSYNSLQLNDLYTSATSIRNLLKDSSYIDNLQKYMPYENVMLLNNFKDTFDHFVFEDLMWPYIKYKYYTDKNSLESIPDISEGLHNRIYKAIDTSSSFKEAIETIKTKRYTYTRLSRILCQYFVGIDKLNGDALRKTPCPYARVLGFTDKGRDILKEMKKKSSIPIYTKIPNNHNDSILDLDISCTKCYSLLNNKFNALSDYKNKPIMIK